MLHSAVNRSRFAALVPDHDAAGKDPTGRGTQNRPNEDAMQETDVQRVMILIAVITPLIAGFLFLAAKMATDQGETSLPRRTRRNLGLLAAAGPANLTLWYLLNGVLQGVGSRSVIGYILAAMAFIVGGFVTGFFSRLRSRGTHGANGEEK